jgi:hypothetical protein
MINVAFEKALRQYWQEAIAETDHGCHDCHTGACCCFRVTATDHEALTLLVGYPEILQAAWPEILSRARFEAKAPSLEAYTRNPIPCPLRKEGRCSVYDLRPWNCAGCHLAPGHDRAVCGQYPSPDAAYVQWAHHPATLVSLLAVQRQVFRGLSLALVHVAARLNQAQAAIAPDAKILTLRH